MTLSRSLAAVALFACLALTGCKRTLDSFDVRQFVDKADDAARKRFAPEICQLRGKDFVLKLRYQSIDRNVEPTVTEIRRALYCREAGKFSRLRQYQLERKSLDITIAPDRKTATAVAHYVETMPYFEEGSMPVSVDDFREYVVIESVDRSQIGIEGGDVVFLGAEVTATEKALIPTSQIQLPFLLD